MKIEIKCINKHYYADLLDLCGSPPIGQGNTKEEAVASLFLRLLHPNNCYGDVVKQIDFKCIEITEGADGLAVAQT